VPKSTAAFSRLSPTTVRSKSVAPIHKIKRTINSLIRLLKDLLLTTAALFTLKSLVISYKTFSIINSFTEGNS
jgi:hypothetical protein